MTNQICTRCGHDRADHERESGPCNVRSTSQHCVCYAFDVTTKQGMHTRTELEQQAIADFQAVLGKVITVTAITGYKDDDSINVDGPSFEVRVCDTPESDIKHWCDEFLDPYWNVEPVKEYSELAGLRSFWTYGKSYQWAKATGEVTP